MDSKHIKVNKNQQIEKLNKYYPHSGFCMFFTGTLCPVLPYYAVMPHILDLVHIYIYTISQIAVAVFYFMGWYKVQDFIKYIIIKMLIYTRIHLS